MTDPADTSPVLVSACLLGRACTYTASDNRDAGVLRLVDGRRAVPVCPEEAGGLPTPRPPAEIQGGTGEDVLDGRARVVAVTGEDVTDAYLAGARVAVARAHQAGATSAVLKARSPSCGVHRIYDGTFSKTAVPGEGVTAAALRRAGVEVVTEEDLT